MKNTETNKNGVPASVRGSQFGCRNCLWSGCECTSGSLYQPKNDTDSECKVYTYYD